MKLYVGNLSYNLTDDELREAFAAHGEVTSAEIVKDRGSGQSKGFGFVEMPSDDQANAAIQALHGTALKGRTLNVNQARPRADGAGTGGRDRHGRPPRSGPGPGRRPRM